MKNKRVQLFSTILLVLLSLVMIFPFFWLVRSALMTDREIMTMPMQWLPAIPRFENFTEALTRVPFLIYFRNSVFVTGINVVGQVMSASFIAFGFARFEFRGKNLWFAAILSTMMIPYTVLMIPQFIGWQAVGAYNTYLPLTIPAFFGNAFNIFLVVQYYRGIPKDYDEAAYVDGANYLQIYAQIMLPMAKPVLCSVGVFAFMNTWNDFLGPLLYLDKEILKTVSLGLQNFIGQYTSSWNLLMAASCVAIIPMIIIFFFAQRYFIEGISFTGLKG